MRINRLLSALFVLAGLLAGCSTMPKETTQLSEAQEHYKILQNDPRSAALAPLEMKKAGDTLDAANHAATEREDDATINHLAYLANQRTAIAEQVINRKAAEKSVEDATKTRDQMRLSDRDQEIQRARMSAQSAQGQAQAAQQQLQQAQDRQKQLEAQLSDLAAKQTARGIVVTLGDILFNVNGSDLKAGGTRSLQKLATALNTDPNLKISVEGFTDSTGSDSHNQALSERRADSVRDALLAMGISSDRVQTHGYGEQYPVASNKTVAGRQLNRRVEIIISDENGKITPR